MDNDKQNLTFQPNPEQVKFAEIYLDYERKLTYTDIAKEIGCSRTTIWKWFQDPEFVNWLNSSKEGLLNKSLMGIYRSAIRRAESGDFQFARMLLEIQGEYTPTVKQDINIKVTEIIISHVVEVINKYVADEDIRKQISQELYNVRLN
jgi:AcrR family transcriptional regulator